MNTTGSVEKDLFENDGEGHPFCSPPPTTGAGSFELTDKKLPAEETPPFLSSFLVEFVQYLKNSLGSIKTFSHLSIDKLEDVEFRKYFYKVLTEDVKKIDSVLNGLLNYININTPIKKANTIHFFLEGILEEYERQLAERKIRVFKKFEKDLPETALHDEQLKYILSSVFQYAIFSTPIGGSIGFLTKSFNVQKGAEDRKVLVHKDGKYVEILIVFTGYQKGIEQFTSPSAILPVQKEEALNLLLMLVRELVQKNRGVLKFKGNEKKPRTIISLTFPAERRKLVYYPPINT
jgi:nitrogen-specific signal transduction histidine kinase